MALRSSRNKRLHLLSEQRGARKAVRIGPPVWRARTKHEKLSRTNRFVGRLNICEPDALDFWVELRKQYHPRRHAPLHAFNTLAQLGVRPLACVKSRDTKVAEQNVRR